MAHLIKLELKKFGTARNIIFTFAAILFSILFITVSLWDSMTDPEQTKDTFESTNLQCLPQIHCARGYSRLLH